MTSRELHAALQQVADALAAMRGNWPPEMRPDTAHAIGYATGAVSKAKALVGRDIDDARAAGE
jgi:hypothetical protein